MVYIVLLRKRISSFAIFCPITCLSHHQHNTTRYICIAIMPRRLSTTNIHSYTATISAVHKVRATPRSQPPKFDSLRRRLAHVTKKPNARTNTACHISGLLLILFHFPVRRMPTPKSTFPGSSMDLSYFQLASTTNRVQYHTQRLRSLHSNRLTLTPCPAEQTIKKYTAATNTATAKENATPTHTQQTHTTKTCAARDIHIYIYILSRRDTQTVHVQIAVPQQSRQTADNTKRYLLVVHLHRREYVAPLAVECMEGVFAGDTN